MSMIDFQDVHKSFGPQKVLDGLSLSVAKGETCVIVGPSGTGKSVTLRHMVGLLSPDAGRVLVEGDDVATSRGEAMERIRAKFGVLFQSGALLNWMNVYDNVALPLYEQAGRLSRRRRLPDAEVRRRVMEKLEMVGLAAMAAKMPAELSGGMKKRAGLARALVGEPEIILYDEPTSGLDPVMSRTIDDLIRDFQRRLGVTSVVVTHDLHSAFEIGDKVVMLYGGKAVFAGTPAEFANARQPQVHEFVRAQFIGNDLIRTGLEEQANGFPPATGAEFGREGTEDEG